MKTTKKHTTTTPILPFRIELTAYNANLSIKDVFKVMIGRTKEKHTLPLHR